MDGIYLVCTCTQGILDGVGLKRVILDYPHPGPLILFFYSLITLPCHFDESKLLSMGLAESKLVIDVLQDACSRAEISGDNNITVELSDNSVS